MFYYEGLSCPVCTKPFSEQDDAVVCPQCGLPHHRDCWKSIGKCFAEDKHGTDRQWSREQLHNDASVDPAPTSTRVCQHCHTENAEYAEFCTRCGCPLDIEDWHSAPQEGNPFVGEYTPFGQPFETYSSEEQIGATNAADLAAIVGNNTHYYVDRFRRIQHSNSGGWNWAAFLLAPIWLFYRKQYALGALYLVLQIMSSVITGVVYAPVQLAETQAAADMAMAEIAQSPMFPLVFASSLIFLMLKILLGIRANHFYLRFCEKKIQKAREKVPDLSVAELTADGGVSVGIAVLAYVVSTILLDVLTITLITVFS